MRDQVDRNFHVTRGERIPAYSFTLQSLLETREATPVPHSKPYSAEAAQKLSAAEGPPSPAAPGVMDVWAYPSEDRAEFVSHVDTYFLPGSLHAEDCKECFQKGELGCKGCMGKGVESCSACLGAGRQSCVFCKGSEKVNCLRCGGEGRLASGEVGGRSARCDACAGTGKFACTHCKEGKVSCPQCQGGGNAPCVKCKGQGKIVCAACGGQKKVLSGKAFQASFKPFQVRGVALAQDGPKEALEMALEKTNDVGALSLSANESLDAQVKDAVVPPAVKGALNELAAREKIQVSPLTRVVKRRLDVAEGAVVRISGYCAGQEFAFWVLPGTNRIVAEKDPLASFGSTTASSAEQARDEGDWKKAIALARESLSYAPHQAGAKDILFSWRRKVASEAVLAGLLGGALSAAVYIVWIVRFEKGLHRTGAILHAGGWQFLLGILTATALIPLLLRVSHFLLRTALLVSVLLSVFLFSGAAGFWAGEQNRVREADQLALQSELSEHFKYGFPQVYFEPDLRYLQALLSKYKDTQVNLEGLKKAVANQLDLREKLGRQQVEFEARVREIVASGDRLGRKQVLLTKLGNQYRLMGVDVSMAEEALRNLQGEENRIIARPPTAPVSRMSITSSEPTRKSRTASTGKGGAAKSSHAKKGSAEKGTKSANKKPVPPPPKKKMKVWWQ